MTWKEFINNEKLKYRILLGVLLLFHLVNFIIFISKHQAYPLWDEGAHMQLIWDYFHLFKSGHFTFIDMLAVSDYYPPLYHLSCVPLVAIMGFGPTPVLIMNFLYGMLGIIFLYKIGKELKNEELS